MNIKRKLLMCLVGILPLISLFGQRIETSEFSCSSNCGFEVKITPNPAVLCEGQQLKLVAEITGGGTALTYNWSSPSMETVANNELVINQTATYKVTVTDANGCEVVATNQVKPPAEDNLDDLFAENCFISIPVTYEGGSGLRNLGNARMEDLVVKIKDSDNTINVSQIFNQGAIAGLNHFYSDNCVDLQIARNEFEAGNTAWAHVSGEGENAMLYIGASPSSSNDAGQEIVNAYHLFWDSEMSDDILSAPINYLCGGDQFLESTIGEGWLITLRKIVTCLSSDPKKGGFVPKCLWECASFTVEQRDLPFAAGLLDGAYQIIKDLADLGKLILEIADLSRALLLYPLCHSVGINEAFFQKLQDKINDPDAFDQIKLNINQTIRISTGADCKDAIKKLKDVNQKVDKTIDFFADFENLVMLYDAITMQFFNYLDEITNCSSLKKCNNAKYEQAKLLFNFASLFFGGTEVKTVNKFNDLARDFWLGVMNRLSKEEAKILANLLRDENFTEKVKKIINSDRKNLLEGVKDDLPPSTWRKIVKDPELLDVWDRIKKRTCPFGGRNPPSGCDALRKKVFADLDADQIKKWDADIESTDNVDFYDKFVGDNDLLDAWKVVENLSPGKSWVRKQVPILEKIKGLDKAKKVALRDIYAKIRIARPRKGTLPKVTVEKNIPGFGKVTISYDKYGFPKFEDRVPLPKSDYKFELPNTRPSNDFKAANEALEAKFGSRTSDKFIWDGVSQNFTIKKTDGTLTKYTWHHHQDGKTLFPVPSNIHHAQQGLPGTGFAHTGGDKLLSVNLGNIFEGPDF